MAPCFIRSVSDTISAMLFRSEPPLYRHGPQFEKRYLKASEYFPSFDQCVISSRILVRVTLCLYLHVIAHFFKLCLFWSSYVALSAEAKGFLL
jgi:hypothetical protein